MRIFAFRSLRSAQTPGIGYSRRPAGGICAILGCGVLNFLENILATSWQNIEKML
jgi:hypothetical protein